MQMMPKKMFSVIALITLLSVYPLSVHSDIRTDVAANRPAREIITDALSKGNGICTVVGDVIKAGGNTADTVENAIMMGHPSCVVVRCAIAAGGQLEDVIISAFRAGASSDVITTCAVEGGADTDALARAIERFALPGLGYTPPAPTYTVYIPTFVPTIGGGGGGESTSPFRP